MNINENIFQKGEKLSFALRELYAGAGFEPYRMSKFEEYDLYARNKDFLVSDNVITFTDTSGTLMALKPDVTLSIIKNSTDEPNICRRVYYNENVYRVSAGSGAFSEIMQAVFFGAAVFFDASVAGFLASVAGFFVFFFFRSSSVVTVT